MMCNFSQLQDRGRFTRQTPPQVQCPIMHQYIYCDIYMRIGYQLLKRNFTVSFYKEPLDLSCQGLTSFQASDLMVSKATSRKPLPPTTQKDLAFGEKSTDHMLQIDWCTQEGWGKPNITPFRMLQLHPFNSSLHYAIQCFEGLKAFKNKKGEIRMFRPECNMYRLKTSTKALCLPDFDGNQFLDCIKELIKIDQRWIPDERGFSLYIRPLHISNESTLGVKQPKSSKLLVMLNPVGPYYESGFQPIRLLTETKNIRSAPGGYGFYKIGGNYGPTMAASRNAKQQNFSQCLWTFEGEVVEVGSSNIFFVLMGQDGIKELHTPFLDDGMILPGVTRDTVIELTRKKLEYRVVQRRINIRQVIQAIDNNRLLQMFSTGTAVIICPVKELGYQGKLYKIPIVEQKKAGDLAFELFNDILDIQEGVQASQWTPKIN